MKRQEANYATNLQMTTVSLVGYININSYTTCRNKDGIFLWVLLTYSRINLFYRWFKIQVTLNWPNNIGPWGSYSMLQGSRWYIHAWWQNFKPTTIGYQPANKERCWAKLWMYQNWHWVHKILLIKFPDIALLCQHHLLESKIGPYLLSKQTCVSRWAYY